MTEDNAFDLIHAAIIQAGRMDNAAYSGSPDTVRLARSFLCVLKGLGILHLDPSDTIHRPTPHIVVLSDLLGYTMAVKIEDTLRTHGYSIVKS